MFDSLDCVVNNRRGDQTRAAPRSTKNSTPATWLASSEGQGIILLVAIFTVHLPYGFSSIKLMAVTSAGAQLGPPGYECDLLYLACLAALVLGGSGPLAIDGPIRKWMSVGQAKIFYDGE
jgi:hypothetical protein